MRGIGERLRTLRGELTQEEVARAAGISRGYLAGIETGRDLPGRDVLDALARLFGVPMEFIQHGTGVPPSRPNKAKLVEDPDQMALLDFWESLNDGERRTMLRMLGALFPDKSIDI